MEGVGRCLDIDVKLAESKACPFERHDPSQLGKEGRETAVAPVGPKRFHELLPPERLVAPCDQEREQQSTLPAGEVRFDTPPLDLEDEPAAKLHLAARQRRANIASTLRRYKRADPSERRHEMAKQITCECGVVIRGETDGEVLDGAREHMRTDHPKLLDQVSEQDLRGWIQEV